MSALERAAMAILAELPKFVGEPYPGKPDFEVSYIDCGEIDLRDIARAALMAVKELDDQADADVLINGRAVLPEFDEPTQDDARACFAAMIDAILNETP